MRLFRREFAALLTLLMAAGSLAAGPNASRAPLRLPVGAGSVRIAAVARLSLPPASLALQAPPILTFRHEVQPVPFAFEPEVQERQAVAAARRDEIERIPILEEHLSFDGATPIGYLKQVLMHRVPGHYTMVDLDANATLKMDMFDRGLVTADASKLRGDGVLLARIVANEEFLYRVRRLRYVPDNRVWLDTDEGLSLSGKILQVHDDGTYSVEVPRPPRRFERTVRALKQHLPSFARRLLMPTGAASGGEGAVVTVSHKDLDGLNAPIDPGHGKDYFLNGLNDQDGEYEKDADLASPSGDPVLKHYIEIVNNAVDDRIRSGSLDYALGLAELARVQEDLWREVYDKVAVAGPDTHPFHDRTMIVQGRRLVGSYKANECARCTGRSNWLLAVWREAGRRIGLEVRPLRGRTHTQLAIRFADGTWKRSDPIYDERLEDISPARVWLHFGNEVPLPSDRTEFVSRRHRSNEASGYNRLPQALRDWMRDEQELLSRATDKWRVARKPGAQDARYTPESRNVFKVESYWIDSDAVHAFRGLGLSAHLAQLFAREKDGRRQVRLLVHPETRAFYGPLIDGAKPAETFWATATASSRTLLLWLPGQENAAFFGKLSLDRTLAGYERTIEADESARSIGMNNILTAEKLPESFAFLPEVFSLHPRGWERGGMIIRAIPPEIREGLARFRPLFSLYAPLPSDGPPLLAQWIKDSGEAPDEFIVKRIIKPFVKQWFDMLLDHGMSMEPHAQNVLMGVAANGLPNGRFLHRDLGAFAADLAYRTRLGLSTNVPLPSPKTADFEAYYVSKKRIERSLGNFDRWFGGGFIYNLDTEVAQWVKRGWIPNFPYEPARTRLQFNWPFWSRGGTFTKLLHEAVRNELAHRGAPDLRVVTERSLREKTAEALALRAKRSRGNHGLVGPPSLQPRVKTLLSARP